MTQKSGQEILQQMDSLHVAPGCLAVWGLGQMGVALQGDDQRVVYIDPVLSDVVAIKIPETADRFQRAFPAPLEPGQICNAAYVLCTHEHLDHTDPLTLGPLAQASPGARFVTSGWAQAALDEAGIAPGRRIPITVEEPVELDGIRVHAIPAAHYEVEHDPQMGYRYLSFLIEWNGVTFFHSGDTILYPGYIERLKGLPRADLALVACNGRDAVREAYDVVGNLLPSEAVWMAQTLEWDVLLPGHNDLFAWNTLPAGALADAAQKLNPRQKIHALQPGELYYYVR
ncbi:MAG: MBL fold metallo-hydrolase [Chloroflexi bacterium]|nr:MBL fold metallo-hydrolase [Chloroflexota bacterium]